MKYFTPELYLRCNSGDDEEADRAIEEWESAIRAYREHLDGLIDQMPSQVRSLADLCLHDAEILAREDPIVPHSLLPKLGPFAFWSGFAILSMRQGRQVVSLIYVLSDRIREHLSEGWPFSKQRIYWLYDEADISLRHQGMFFHRVFLSCGTTLEIPFHSVLIHLIPLE
jgi:hypothetical protein